jgi:hypothetical protein
MDEEAFDNLIDDASHAAFAKLPDDVLEALTDDERGNLLVAINDALAPVLREAVGA